MVKRWVMKLTLRRERKECGRHCFEFSIFGRDCCFWFWRSELGKGDEGKMEGAS